MTPIGETLRRERLRLNLDFHEISKELKIAPHLLEAIEAERFERLPGGVFAKSFVRQYANLLGLDGDEMAAEVARILEPPEEVQPAEPPDLPPIAGLHLPSMDAWRRVGGASGGWSSWLKSAAVIVVATLACSAIYVLWERSREAPARTQTATVQTAPAPRSQPQSAQPQAAQVQPAPPAPATPGPAAPAQSTTAEQIPSASTGLAERVAPNTPAAPAGTQGAAAISSGNAVHVQITAAEPVWVRASNNGKYLFSETLNPNQTRTVDAEGAVELRLGNAGGVEIQLNGKPIGNVGPKGQVRTVQLTSGGFRIESPSKPAVPPAL